MASLREQAVDRTQAAHDHHDLRLHERRSGYTRGYTWGPPGACTRGPAPAAGAAAPGGGRPARGQGEQDRALG